VRTATRRWWSTPAGFLLLLNAVTVALYSGIFMGSAPWTSPLPIIGPVPVFPIVFAAMPAFAGIGILRRAGWARWLGIGLAMAYLLVDVTSLLAKPEAGPAVDTASSLFIAFALLRRWTSRKATRTRGAPPAKEG
jgi:hypothetical protein